MRFVALSFYMAERRRRKVHRNGDVRRLQLAQHAEQRVGEAIDGGNYLARAANRKGMIALCPVRAVDNAVAVEDYEARREFRFHVLEYSTGASAPDQTAQAEGWDWREVYATRILIRSGVSGRKSKRPSIWLSSATFTYWPCSISSA